MKSIVEQYNVISKDETTSIVSKDEVTQVLTSREVVNLTINYIGSRTLSKMEIVGDDTIGSIKNTEIAQRILVEITEPFDNAEMTIGDDDATARLVTVNDVNLSRVGMYEIASYVRYTEERLVKIYFNKTNTVGKLNVIIIIG